MGRRRAARTPMTSTPTNRALVPLRRTDLAKHIPIKFVTLWVDTASGNPEASCPPISTFSDELEGVPGGVVTSGESLGSGVDARATA